MTTIGDIAETLEQLAPSALAEDWDNVGLLVGDPQAAVEKVMTCLTITPTTAAEAVRDGANLIVTHHPLPFRSLKRITTDQTPGRLLLELIRAGVAVYSAHTAYDSASQGINQQLSAGLRLSAVQPLVEIPAAEDAALGTGRCGALDPPRTLAELATAVKGFLRLPAVRVVGKNAQTISRLAVACGSAGQFLADARRRDCDALLTGETNFHTCLEAEASGTALILTGHYASERFAVETLARQLSRAHPALTIWPSRDESDPLRTL